MKLLAKVEEVFPLPTNISQYRCVIVFRFLAADGRIRPKDEIQLRTPDQRVMETYVAAIEHLKYQLLGPPPDKNKVGICLPPEVSGDVPPGTEIWVREADEKGSGALVETS